MSNLIPPREFSVTRTAADKAADTDKQISDRAARLDHQQAQLFESFLKTKTSEPRQRQHPGSTEKLPNGRFFEDAPCETKKPAEQKSTAKDTASADISVTDQEKSSFSGVPAREASQSLSAKDVPVDTGDGEQPSESVAAAPTLSLSTEASSVGTQVHLQPPPSSTTSFQQASMEQLDVEAQAETISAAGLTNTENQTDANTDIPNLGAQTKSGDVVAQTLLQGELPVVKKTDQDVVSTTGLAATHANVVDVVDETRSTQVVAQSPEDAQALDMAKAEAEAGQNVLPLDFTQLSKMPLPESLEAIVIEALKSGLAKDLDEENAALEELPDLIFNNAQNSVAEALLGKTQLVAPSTQGERAAWIQNLEAQMSGYLGQQDGTRVGMTLSLQGGILGGSSFSLSKLNQSYQLVFYVANGLLMDAMRSRKHELRDSLKRFFPGVEFDLSLQRVEPAFGSDASDEAETAFDLFS